MKSKMKTIIYTVLMCVILLVGSFVYAHIDKKNLLHDGSIDTSKYVPTGNLRDEFLEQTFLCEENSLDGIVVKTQLFGDVSNVKVKYQLFELGSDKLIAEGKLAAKEMKNNQFSEFCFEKKVANTCDKKYTIRLMEEKTSDENGVGFYHDKKDGTLVAKTITKRFDLETFIMVISFVLFIWGFFKVLYKLFK